MVPESISESVSPKNKSIHTEHDEASAIERILRRLWKWQEMRGGVRCYLGNCSS